MALILCIETSTDVCSVALAKDGFLLSIAENDEPKSHAGTLTKFIGEVMNVSALKLSQLDAISISKGPGSYTGLRIGTAAAKGLCYALNRPLIAINTLQSMANFFIASQHPESKALFIPLMDARRMEVYTAIFDESLNEISETRAEVIHENSFSEVLKDNKIFFFGNGITKCKNVLKSNSNAIFAEDVRLSASGMVVLSEKKFIENKFEDIAYFEPYYLKDFVTNKPKV